MGCIRIYIIPRDIVLPSYMLTDGYVLLDFEESLRLGKDLESSADLDRISRERVVGSTLKLSDKNAAVLNGYKSINTDGGYPQIPCFVLDGAVEQIYNLLVIRNWNDEAQTVEFELTTTEDTHWIDAARQLSIRDIPFGSYVIHLPHYVTAWGDIEYANGDIGVNFPAVLFGGLRTPNGGALSNQNSGFVWNVGDFRPHLSILAVLQKGFCQIGWHFRSTVLETTFFRKVWAYVCDDRIKGTTNPVALMSRYFYGARQDGETVIIQENVAYIIRPNYSANISDISNGYVFANVPSLNNNQYQFITAGFFNVFASIRVGLLAQGTRRISFSLNIIVDDIIVDSFEGDRFIAFGVVTPVTRYVEFSNVFNGVEIPSQITSGLRVELILIFSKTDVQTPGDNGQTTVTTINTGGVHTLTAIFVPYSFNDTLFVNDVLRDIPFINFLKGIIHVCNGKLHTDFVTRTVWLYPPETVSVFGQTATGFHTGEVEVIPVDRSRVLTFDTDIEDDGIQGLAFLDGKEYVKKGTGKSEDDYNENPLFIEVINRDVPTMAENEGAGIGNPKGAVIDIPTILDNEDGLVNVESQIIWDVKPYLLYFHGLTRQIVGSEESTISIIPVAPFSGLGFFRQVPYAGQVLNRETVLDSGFVTQKLMYGTDINDLYNLFWRFDLTGDPLTVTIQKRLIADDYYGVSFRPYRLLKTFEESVLKLISVEWETCDKSLANMVFKRQSSSICPAPVVVPCDNSAIIQISMNEAGCFSAIVVLSGSSPVTSQTFESSLNGTVWSAYTAGTPICEPLVYFRVIVVFDDDCPDLTVSRTISKVCNNTGSIVIDFDPDTLCASANGDDDFLSTVDTDVWTVSINGAAPISYTPDTEICSFTSVDFNRIVEFTDECPPLLMQAAFSLDTPCFSSKHVVAVLDNGYVTFTIEGTSEGTVMEERLFISVDGGNYYQYFGEPVCEDSITIKAVITFCDCPTICLFYEYAPAE